MILQDGGGGVFAAEQTHRHPDPRSGEPTGVVQPVDAGSVSRPERAGLPQRMRQAEGGSLRVAKSVGIVADAGSLLDDNAVAEVDTRVGSQVSKDLLAELRPSLGRVI